jgi:hypothetical protein
MPSINSNRVDSIAGYIPAITGLRSTGTSQLFTKQVFVRIFLAGLLGILGGV